MMKVDNRKYKKIESFFCKDKEIVSIWQHKLTGLYRAFDEVFQHWISDLSGIDTCEKIGENYTE